MPEGPEVFGACCDVIGTGTAPAGGAVVFGGAADATALLGAAAATGCSLGVVALTEDAGEESADAFLLSSPGPPSDLVSLFPTSPFESCYWFIVF